MKLLLKEAVSIQYMNGFIVTSQEVPMKEKPDTLTHTPNLTYLRPQQAVEGIYKQYGVTTSVGEVLKVYEESKRLQCIKQPKPNFSKEPE